jgi:hypothetical protein
VIRRILPLALCLVLVGLLAPAGVRAGDPWTVSANTDEVRADFLTQSGSDASLYLENHVSFDVPGDPNIGIVLDALGFGGGYSQEVSWTNGRTGPTVSCPKGITDLFSFCSSDADGGSAIVPNGLRTELVLTGSDSGNINLTVSPTRRSLGYDAVVSAIGIALETLSPGVIPQKTKTVADLAIKLLPEASGLVDALARGDLAAAGKEFLSIAWLALKTILDHVVDFAIGHIVDLIPGALWVRLGLAASKVLASEIELTTHLLSGYSNTTVTVGHTGAGGAAVKPTPTPTPAPTPTPPAMNEWTWKTIAAPPLSALPGGAELLNDGHMVLVGPGSNWGPSYYPLCTDDIVGGPGSNGFDGEEYDPSSGAWQTLPKTTLVGEIDGEEPLPHGQLLVVGVTYYDDEGGANPAAAIYDGPTNTWSPVPAPKALYGSAMATLTDGRVALVGGDDAQGNSLNTVEAFDPSTKAWAEIGTVPASAYLTAALPGDRLLVSGATSAGDPTLYVFDAASGGGKEIAPGSDTRWDQFTRTSSGRIVGLTAIPDKSSIRVAVFDPASLSWSAGYTQPVPEASSTMILQDGTVIVAGGRVVTGSCDDYDNMRVTILATVTAIDPFTGGATTLASLPQPAVMPSLAELPGDRLMWIGAYEHPATAEVLGP